MSELFDQFMKPKVTPVMVDFKGLEPYNSDENQLLHNLNASSCTIEETDYSSIDLGINEFSQNDYFENSEENGFENSSRQTTDNSLQSMVSYCFDKDPEFEQESQVLEHRSLPVSSIDVNKVTEVNNSDEKELTDYSSSLSDVEEFDNIDESVDNVYVSSGEESTRSNYVLETHANNEDQGTECVITNTKKRKYHNTEKLTRKRKRRPENWQTNVRKNAVNHGLEYTHYKTDDVVSARELGRSCGPGCRFKCDSRIDESRRKEIFNLYWNTSTQSEKYNFISRHITETSLEDKENSTKKLFSRKYFLTNDVGNKVAVCKTMFLSTLSINHSIVDNTLKKSRGDVSVLKDMRGSSKKKTNKISQEKTDSVIEHINMFQRVESHYTRKDSEKEYLEETLSLSKMYRMYLEWTKENNKPTASKHHYFDTFNEEFNIGFFSPKKDQCNHCEEFKNAAEHEKISLEPDYNLHIKNKDKARLERDNDILFAKENFEKTSLICFDFQKILSTPKTEASVLYYKRKLSVYNFTIYDIIRRKGYCYVWSEDDAKKGSNEVASCLLHYFEKVTSEGKIDTLLLYSDNCGGQNRNKNVFAMYTYASAKYKIDIRHTFFEVGHTQNQGDSVHAVIEKYAKGRKIYTMGEWCDIIREAKVENPKYEVINVTYDMIYDFKALAIKQNWKKTTAKNGKKSCSAVGVSKFKVVKTSKNQLNQLQFKTSFEEDYITLATRKEKEQANVSKYNLCKAYDSRQGLPAAKLKDLLSLCNSIIIPSKYHDYYQKFTTKVNIEIETGSGDEDND